LIEGIEDPKHEEENKSERSEKDDGEGEEDLKKPSMKPSFKLGLDKVAN